MQAALHAVNAVLFHAAYATDSLCVILLLLVKGHVLSWCKCAFRPNIIASLMVWLYTDSAHSALLLCGLWHVKLAA